MINHKTVLIVDDSSFDRNILKKTLEKSKKYIVLQCSSGKECLTLLATKSVDMLLLDIVMPDMDGTQVLECLRQNYNPIELPIILITANANPLDIVEALKLGANDYVPKHQHFEILLSRIESHIKLCDLSRQMTKMQKLAALHNLISTYQHELNNPLAIALGHLQNKNWNKEEKIKESLTQALWRIADIVKKIASLKESDDIQIDEGVEILELPKSKSEP